MPGGVEPMAKVRSCGRWLVAVCVVCSVCADLNYDDMMGYLYRRNVPTEPNYNESFFSSLENYEVNALDITEEKYPWIARVVHSRALGRPHVCTAVCVQDRVFITAGRCLYSLKVSYTSVIYQRTQFSVIAFVLPTTQSKQAFDDIGFIVVNEESFKGQWATVQLLDTTNRTDDNFNWFADLIPEDNWDHVVVGYATERALKNMYLQEDGQYKLTELEVITNINICPEILIYNKLLTGFHVPCYHSCSVQQFKNKDPKCSKYLGALGAAVFNTKSNKLLGIATWGASFHKYELPVGFSTPNSKNFFQDFVCARRIKLDRGNLVINGYYEALCEDIY